MGRPSVFLGTHLGTHLRHTIRHTKKGLCIRALFLCLFFVHLIDFLFVVLVQHPPFDFEGVGELAPFHGKMVG